MGWFGWWGVGAGREGGRGSGRDEVQVYWVIWVALCEREESSFHSEGKMVNVQDTNTLELFRSRFAS